MPRFTMPNPMNLTDEEIRVKCAEAMGWRWVKARYDGMSACPPSARERLFFLDAPLGPWRDWVLSESSEEGQMNISVIERLPNYLTSVDAALTLCDRLREEGWNVVIVGPGTIKDWYVDFAKNGTIHKTDDPSLARAICLAFLKACRV